MAPQLRLVPTDPAVPAPVIADDDDDDSLGAMFEAFNEEIHRILAKGRGEATTRSLGGVLLHLAALAEDYRGVPMPPPAGRT